MSNYLDNLELFDPKAIAKGRASYKEKKVTILEATPNAVKARVFANGQFNVHLQFDADHDLVSATCDCPTVGFCDHMVSAIYQASDFFASGDAPEETGDEVEKTLALSNAVEDVKNSVFRFNYKGLSKAMDVYFSILTKSDEEGKFAAMKALFTAFLSKGKYPIDYDRLTPYIREVLKKSSFPEEKIVAVFYDLLGEHMALESFWSIMNRDAESAEPFQKAALKRIEEGMAPPYYLSTACPPTSWAFVNPALLDELLDTLTFYLSHEQMAELIHAASARKDLDAIVELFRIAIKNFDGFILDPSILTSLLNSEEHRKKVEMIFYEEFTFSPSPEKYLLWRSVATDEDFHVRFEGKIANFEGSTRDFILLHEGRPRVGDIYDSLDVRSIPFPLLAYALENVEEEFAKQELLDYCEEEEAEILRDLDHRAEDVRILTKVYSRFGKEQLRKMMGNPFIMSLAKNDTYLRGKLLLAAYENSLLPTIGVKVYQE